MDNRMVNTRTYFKFAISYLRKHHQDFNIEHYTSRLTMWTHVRCLVYVHYGVHDISQMKPEWQKEANALAINIMELIRSKHNENS